MNDKAYTLLERLSMGVRAEVAPTLLVSRESLLSRLRADLSMLLNTSGLPGSLNLSATPHAANSVINYGIGNIAGQTLSALHPKPWKDAFGRPSSLTNPELLATVSQVSWIANSSEPMADLQFLIQGQLRSGMQVYPFKFRSLWNIQSGAVHVDSPDGAQRHG